MTLKMTNPPPLDIEAIRTKLAGERGKQLWRCLEEVAETPQFQEFLDREFPQGASELSRGVERRTFLKLLGASLGLAGLTGCGSPPKETIVPYVKQPQNIVPGKTQSYASAVTLGGFANGVLVTSNLGRPTKIDGNPDHPASLGSTDHFMQASVLGLYDPDRAQTVTSGGRIRTWAEFADGLTGALRVQATRRGAGLRILTETITSPTLAALLTELLTALPEARVHSWEPINRDAARAGAELAFGDVVTAHHDFAKPDVIVSLDLDFLGSGPGQVAATRAYSTRRKVRAGAETAMNRLYVIEGSPTITGANADHAWCVRPSAIGVVAQALARELGVDVPGVDLPRAFPGRDKWLLALARDLKRDGSTGLDRAPGTTLVVCGETQAAPVHALVHAINEKLGNHGTTVRFTKPVEAHPVSGQSKPATTQVGALAALVGDLSGGTVDTLLILGGNPVYNAPADLKFAEALAKARLKVHLGPYRDETSAACDWHLPESHALESWGDARAFDGTVSIVQPLTEPLYQTRTAIEVVAALLGRNGTPAYELVRTHWMAEIEGDFEIAWERALHDGVLAGRAEAQVAPSLQADRLGSVAFTSEPPPPGTFEVAFRPDPTVWDGRFANSGWLQELPKPLSRLTWDNAALVAPELARQLGLVNGRVLKLKFEGRELFAPIWILPGAAPDTITLPLGYGRTRGGRLAVGAGFSAFALRSTTSPWQGVGMTAVRTSETRELASTQMHWSLEIQRSLEGRDIIRSQSITDWTKHGGKFGASSEHGEASAQAGAPAEVLEPNFYPPPPESPNQWAMSIDLSSCTGCNACVIACQAENNVPVVGKAEILRGRSMHWIRIDRYYEGSPDVPDATHQQPILCMHCENAPCEVVCPVNATSHSEEGLNEQTYNRCVGTKYCSNNCPYKVRRFNFFQYSDTSSPTLKMLQNPEVTVRARGVMEKCSYCVQRIDHARIDAKKAFAAGERPDMVLTDADVVTACQTACPAQAIVFGNLNDPNSGVAKIKKQPHDYGLLTELNTKPRTTYLSKVKNPNPLLGKAS